MPRKFLATRLPSVPPVPGPESWEPVTGEDVVWGDTRPWLWVGEARNFSGNTVPPGWLRGDGSEVAKATYPVLWARYDNGTRHGPPSAPGRFLLPNYGPLEALVPATRYWVWPGEFAPQNTFDSAGHTFDGTEDTWDGE